MCPAQISIWGDIMMEYLRIEYKRLAKNKLIVAAYVAILFVMVADPISVYWHAKNIPDFSSTIGVHPYQYWILINSAGWGNTIYNSLLWILPMLLTGFTLYDDTSSSVKCFSIIRKNRTSYLFSKVVSVSSFSFFFVLSFLLVNLLVTYLVFPIYAFKTEQFYFYVPNVDSFSYFFYKASPIMMGIAYSLLNALAVSLLTVFCVGMHMCFDFPHKYVAAIVPIIMIYGCCFLLDSSASLMYINIRTVIQPLAAAMLIQPITWTKLLLAYGLWMVLDFLLLMFGLKKSGDVF